MQNSNVKISVIIPVYNVEKYIERAVDSILSQSFSDFEIYLVDDGSTDSSSKILDDYQKKDNRIHVIHQKNAGAFSARNIALKNIHGEYVCFFDGDDYIEKDMLRDMYDLATKNGSDLIVSGFYIHTYYDDDNYLTFDYIPYTRNDKPIDVFDNAADFRKYSYLNFDKNMFYPPWNKMYKTSYLKDNNIFFPKTYRDDFPFVISTIRNIEKVTYTKKQYYHFIRKRSDSETQKYYPNLYAKREEEHKKMLDLYDEWKLSHDVSSLDMISRRYIDRLIECITNLYNAGCKLSDKEKIYEIKKILSNKYLDDSLKYAKPKKMYLKFMYIPIKLKNCNLCSIMAKFINNVKNKNIALFSSLKTNR